VYLVNIFVKMVTKKKISKKKVSRKKPVSKKGESKISTKELILKKIKVLNNMFRFGFLFIISLVLYFATSNPVLDELFGLIAIVSGAVFVMFFLIFVGILLYKKTKKK